MTLAIGFGRDAAAAGASRDAPRSPRGFAARGAPLRGGLAAATCDSLKAPPASVARRARS